MLGAICQGTDTVIEIYASSSLPIFEYFQILLEKSISISCKY